MHLTSTNLNIFINYFHFSLKLPYVSDTLCMSYNCLFILIYLSSIAKQVNLQLILNHTRVHFLEPTSTKYKCWHKDMTVFTSILILIAWQHTVQLITNTILIIMVTAGIHCFILYTQFVYIAYNTFYLLHKLKQQTTYNYRSPKTQRDVSLLRLIKI